MKTKIILDGDVYYKVNLWQNDENWMLVEELLWVEESFFDGVTFETQKQEEASSIRVWRESSKEETTARAKALRTKGA